MTTTLPPTGSTALWESVTAASSAAITATMQPHSVAAGLPLLSWSLQAAPTHADGLALVGLVDPCRDGETAQMIVRAYASTFDGGDTLDYRDGGNVTFVESAVTIAGTPVIIRGVRRWKTGGAR